MNHAKKPGQGRPFPNGFAIRPKLFVFFDKSTGIPRFELSAGDDGSLPVDQAVSLLAVHCVARQKMPQDFGVMVAAGEDLVAELVQRTTKVIKACSRARPTAALSLRQHEVLAGIMENLSNKEIAQKLNICERTVKFHVSALLAKFDVRGRVDLMLEAGNVLPHEAVHRRGQNRLRVLTPLHAAPSGVGLGNSLAKPVALERRAAR